MSEDFKDEVLVFGQIIYFMSIYSSCQGILRLLVLR
jgi:hypothetical protein